MQSDSESRLKVFMELIFSSGNSKAQAEEKTKPHL